MFPLDIRIIICEFFDEHEAWLNSFILFEYVKKNKLKYYKCYDVYDRYKMSRCINCYLLKVNYYQTCSWQCNVKHLERIYRNSIIELQSNEINIIVKKAIKKFPDMIILKEIFYRHIIESDEKNQRRIIKQCIV